MEFKVGDWVTPRKDRVHHTSHKIGNQFLVLEASSCYLTLDTSDRETVNTCNWELVVDPNIKKVVDMVNHPKHYNTGSIEVIDVIEDWGLGFNDGNVIKYCGRAKHKGTELQDLKKALWYLERHIKNVEKANE